MSNWPMVPLGELLHKSDDWIPLRPDTTYQEVTVRLWGKGATLRRNATGAEIASAKRLRVRAGQFIISRIDARNGASGIIPVALDGAVVSSDFPVFSTNSDRLLPEFLGWFSKTKSFIALCASASEGTTNRVRLKEPRFLTKHIPLPALTEQRRLVEQIDALAAKLAEAKTLFDVTAANLHELSRSILRDATHGPPIPTVMSDLVRLRQPDVQVRPDEQYHFAGIYCFGRGVFIGQKKLGMEFMYPKLTRLRAGNFVYPKLMAWEGALAVVPPECDGLVVSTEYPVFEIDRDKVLPEVLDVYFRTPAIWPELSGASTGTNVRRRRLNPADFLSYRMPLPIRAIQLKLQDVQRRSHIALAERRQAAIELDAMLPAILDRAFMGAL